MLRQPRSPRPEARRVAAGGPQLPRVQGAIRGEAAAAPRHGLRPGRHRAAGTARVGLTPGFESVQEAAYQRSCCLCRFLSLLLPHPACRPHTYRPHRRSSAPPGCLQPQPRSPPANPRRVPVDTASLPPKSWGAPRGVSARARGARGALCAQPQPGPAVGTRRDGWEPGHGDGDAGRGLSVASRGILALPRATLRGLRTGPPPVPHCLHPLTRCCSQPGRSISHPPCPAMGDLARIHLGVPPAAPLQLGPPQRGRERGRQVPGGSGSGRTGLPALGPLHILPAMPSGARCLLPQPCHSSCLSWPRLCAQTPLGPFPSSSAPTPLQRPRCSPPAAPGAVAQMPSPLASLVGSFEMPGATSSPADGRDPGVWCWRGASVCAGVF
ncbi:atrophin-1-like [Cygnus olor]|uniref:atrophin-1-like n=1 Tax=Cygnus olor TaxID=8869 RepID=UPI001ADE8E67|nr:atrophin-1-like [Cygnus olor]